MALGLCVSPGTMPDRAEVDRLNPAFIRSILYIPEDLYRLLALGRSLYLTINGEFSMVRNWEGWEDAIWFVAAHGNGQVKIVLCGNEFDAYWSKNRSNVPPGFAADLVNRAQPILRASGIDVGTTSVAGPEWVTYLDNMLRYCAPDYVDLHPYGWAQAGLENKLAELERVARGHKMLCTEVGVHIADAGGEQAQAGLLTHAASVLEQRGVEGAWFAWHDANGAPWERGETAFGLVAEDGRRRPAWQAFAALAQHVAPAGSDLSAWRGKVGTGLLEMMARDGTQPAAPSWWHTNDIDEGVHAENGDTYIWLAAEGRGYRVPRKVA